MPWKSLKELWISQDLKALLLGSLWVDSLEAENAGLSLCSDTLRTFPVSPKTRHRRAGTFKIPRSQIKRSPFLHTLSYSLEWEKGLLFQL
jgi:hypothetical protein